MFEKFWNFGLSEDLDACSMNATIDENIMST